MDRTNLDQLICVLVSGTVQGRFGAIRRLDRLGGVWECLEIATAGANASVVRERMND